MFAVMRSIIERILIIIIIIALGKIPELRVFTPGDINTLRHILHLPSRIAICLRPSFVQQIQNVHEVARVRHLFFVDICLFISVHSTSVFVANARRNT